ncbi:MAG: protein phosphatase 2C domain-containing protein [Nitrospinota bacterium]|nr:protein phosphatase 2C domain-containing protein [Nitrospinota bacterium]
MIIVEAEKYNLDDQEFCSGRLSAFSERAPGYSNPNEDSIAMLCLGDGTGVLVVADGMGGRPSGEKAARIIAETFNEILAGHKGEEDLRGAILEAIEKSNERIKELQVGAGSTVVAVEIQGQQIRPYHVGDSSVIIVGQRGKLKYQSIAHSPVGYALESGIIAGSELENHDEKHIVSNIVGSDDMRIEIGSFITLDARDTVLLTTDGVTDNLTLERIIEIIRKGDLESVRENLSEQAKMNMENSDEGFHPDDISFILFRVN